MALDRFFRPTCVVRNVSTKAVRVIGLTTLKPGETRDLYNEIDPRIGLFEDPILKGLEKPHGDLYREIVLKRTLQVLVLDLPQFHYSVVSPTNINSTNSYTPGQVPIVVDDERFQWVNLVANSAVQPLVINGGEISIPPADVSTDGYLTKEDWARFNAAVRGPQRIWQYQDFTAPVGTSLTLSAFENGTGMAFDSGYILDGTASVVLVSDNTAPPTTSVTFPGNVFPGNRVVVSSHIGTTVILNQAPDASLTCRVFYLTSIPANIPLPNDYQEAPDFLKGAEYENLDDSYVNQNEDETIYGDKTFEGDMVLNGGLQISTGAVDGYYLRTDGTGNAVWAPVIAGSGAGDVTGASNIGSDGYGFFFQKLGSTLQFKNIAAASNRVIIDEDGYNILIDVNPDSIPANIDLDGYIFNGANVGADGYGVFAQKNGQTLEFKNIAPGSNNITVAEDLNDNILVDVDLSAVGAGLGLDGYASLDGYNVFTNTVTFNPSNPTDPPFTIVQDGYAPTTNISGGSYTVISGIQYIYDDVRNKWLSTERKFLTAGEDSNNVSNAYLEISETVTSSDSGFRLLRDGTITGLWMQTRDAETWTFQVRRNGVTTAIASLVATVSRGNSDNTINIDVNQDDEIQFFASGTGISKPVVGLEIAWRI